MKENNGNRAADSGLQKAIERCAQEQVHVPGAIQPHGALLALSPDSGRVLWVSENIEGMLELLPGACDGMTLREMIGTDFTEELHAVRETSPASVFRFDSRSLPASNMPVSVLGYEAKSGERILEFEQLRPGSRSVSLGTFNDWMHRLYEQKTRTSVLDTLVVAARDLLCCDRAKVYAFDTNWHGTVVAESRNTEVPSYLHHRFPAHDIPPQVRAMYEVNPLRCIVDAGAAPVPLRALLHTELPRVNLSRGVLRAVSPVHAAYLSNMGVRGAMSVAIHREDCLWGLLACHHRQPLVLHPETRDAVLLLVQAASQQLFLIEARKGARFRERVVSHRRMLVPDMRHSDGPHVWLRRHGEAWLELVDACGGAYADGTDVTVFGIAPEDARVSALASWLSANLADDDVWATVSAHKVPVRDLFDADCCCGIVATRVSMTFEAKDGWLMFFRPEQLHTVRWAGDPNARPDDVGPDGVLTPRHSFTDWVEQVRGSSTPWHALERKAVRELGQDLALLASGSRINVLRRELECENAELERLTQALQRSNRELHDFARIVSHDLQEPLRKLMQFSERLLDTAHADNRNDRDYLQRIGSASRRMQRLVRDVLDYSRLEGQVRALKSVALQPVLKGVLHDLEVRIRETGACIQVGQLPVVIGDATQLHQLFQNLISNALKFRRPGGVPVVQVHAKTSVSRGAEICVEDNGVGIDPAVRDHIFEPFVRLGGRGYEGSGLGLSIVRRIAQHHNIGIQIESTGEGGSRIRLKFPA